MIGCTVYRKVIPIIYCTKFHPGYPIDSFVVKYTSMDFDYTVPKSKNPPRWLPPPTKNSYNHPSLVSRDFSWKVQTFEDLEDQWCGIFFLRFLCGFQRKHHWVDHVHVFQSFQLLVMEKNNLWHQNKLELLVVETFLVRSVQQLYYYV